MIRRLPVFPLGTVLMPTQLLPLHIFEPRYRELMRQLTEPDSPRQLGVVLIERGHEVGGGDQRVATGTVGRLDAAQQTPDGRWMALFTGTDRFRVVEWLPDDPFPQARVEELPEPEWDAADEPALIRAEELVRETLALAAELGEAAVPAGLELVDDPAQRTWQLCAAAPLGPFDRQRLLEAPTPIRLATLVEQTADARQMLAFRLGGG
jgi:Lon protease-like protein